MFSYRGRGIAHEKKDKGCQDYLKAAFADNGNCILALSDGASSADYAQASAEVTVSSLVEYFSNVSLSEFLSRSTDCQVREILNYLQNQIRGLSKEKECTDLRQFSSTVLLAVSDREDVLIFHLGDGEIFLLDTEGNICFVSGPDNAPGTSNVTYFSVSNDAEEHARLSVFSIREMRLESILMMSDGPEMMFYNRGIKRTDRTAAEILGYVRDGIIKSNEDLADILDQMAEIPAERMDDWSMIISDFRSAHVYKEPVVVSMLEEEHQKYLQE